MLCNIRFINVNRVTMRFRQGFRRTAIEVWSLYHLRRSAVFLCSVFPPQRITRSQSMNVLATCQCRSKTTSHVLLQLRDMRLITPQRSCPPSAVHEPPPVSTIFLYDETRYINERTSTHTAGLSDLRMWRWTTFRKCRLISTEGNGLPELTRLLPDTKRLVWVALILYLKTFLFSTTPTFASFS